MRRVRFYLRLAPLILLLGVAPRAWARPLMIAAASSLEESVRQSAAAFQKTHPNVKIDFNFAGSNVLARQIEAGAPIDIFLSADEALVKKLDEKKLLLDPHVLPLFSNQLVVIAAPDAKFIPKNPQDLLKPEIKTIALSDPNVPAGKYAAAYLEKAGVLKKLAPKITTSENVRATLTLVTKGRANAGIVYKTDLKIAKPTPPIAWEIPVSETPGIVYAGAVTKACTQPETCRAFLTYMTSPEGHKIFMDAGFAPLPK